MEHDERLAAMQAHADAMLAAPRVKREDRTSMTFWLPKLEAAGLPTPKTIMVEITEDERREVWRVFDGQKPGEAATVFLDRLRAAGASIGFPCFLRTSHTSGKHDWDNTCMWRDPAKALHHVARIIEYGEMGSIFGMPHDWWAVREYLPVKPLAVCHGWSNMPVCREFRMFVRDATVECWHSYWPQYALEQGGALDPAGAFVELNECHDVAGLHALASKAGAACGGYWSVDIMDTDRGWYITDMAEGEQSFHWEGCQNAKPD